MFRISRALLAATVLIATPSLAEAAACNTVAACAFYSNVGGIAIEGSSPNYIAIYGLSSHSHGTDGRSGTSYGAVGITYADGRFSSTARSGVFGQDLNPNGGPLNTGVTGTSLSGVGGYFISQTGDGLIGSGNGIGVIGTGSVNGGYFIGSDGLGLYAESDAGNALQANNAATQGDSIQMVSSSSSLMEGFYNNPSGKTPAQVVVSIDSSGNEILAGSLIENGSPEFRTRTTGSDVASYGARTASPTIEDFGTGQLRNGSASVALDATFASTMDKRSAYMVFVTPHGDSNGLYTQTSPTGFVVHENKAGHSTLAFDYRIVAKPLDARATHLPAMGAMKAANVKSFKRPAVLDAKRNSTPLHAISERAAADAFFGSAENDYASRTT